MAIRLNPGGQPWEKVFSPVKRPERAPDGCLNGIRQAYRILAPLQDKSFLDGSPGFRQNDSPVEVPRIILTHSDVYRTGVR